MTVRMMREFSLRKRRLLRLVRRCGSQPVTAPVPCMASSSSSRRWSAESRVHLASKDWDTHAMDILKPLQPSDVPRWASLPVAQQQGGRGSARSEGLLLRRPGHAFSSQAEPRRRHSGAHRHRHPKEWFALNTML